MKSNKFLKEFGAIFSSEVVLLAASFISFPIFSRMLSKTDYGFMSLITISLMLFANIGSGGLNSAVLRYFGKYTCPDRSPFVNTMRTATLGLGVFATLIYTLVAWAAYGMGELTGNAYTVVAFASLLILIRALTKVELSFLRISDHVMLMNFFNVLIRYGSIGLSIWLVYTYKSLFSLYIGTLVAEFAVLLIMYVYIKTKIADLDFVPSYDGLLCKEAFFYGYPLALTGLLSVILSSTDRYVIGFFLNTEKVADYTVAVNYCNYPIEILRNVYLSTFVPMIMNSWNDENTDSDAQHLTNYLSSYCWLAIPIVFGLALTDVEGIKLLAGSKYTAVPYLVPLLATAFALNGMNFVFISGLLYKRKTTYVLYLNVLTNIINLVLNVLLVSKYGVYGAAISTLISYLVFIVIANYYSRREMTFVFPVKDIFLSCLAGLSMFIVVTGVTRWMPLENLLVSKIVTGFISYTLFFVLFDRSKLILLTKALKFRKI